MDAHAAKCFIKLVQILQFSRMLLGFDLLSRSDPVQTFFAQHNLHINPPIKIVEGYEDPGFQVYWIIHLAASGQHNSSKFFNLPAKTLQFKIKPIQTLSTSTSALSLGASHLARLLWTKSRGRKARIPGVMWNPITFGASMEVSEAWSWPEHLLWYHV